jgi:amidase
LESLGHHVEEARPDIDGKAIAKNFFTLYFGETAAEIEALKSHLGRNPKPSDVEALTWTIGLLGRAVSAGEFVSARRAWDLAAEMMARFHEEYDLYLTPTSAHPPAKIGELQPRPYERIAMKVVNALGLGRLLKASGLTDRMAETNLSRTPFTQLANMTGQPAMSLPLHWAADGLPIGVQFMAPFGDEATLFRLAAQLEKERPWFDKHGEVWAG